MNVIKIYSKNASYQKFEALKSNRNKRHKYGEFMIEGVKNINASIKNRWHIKHFLYSSEAHLSDWAKNLFYEINTEANYDLRYELLSELSGKENASEIIAVADMKREEINIDVLHRNPIFVLLDRPSNKGNLGAMIRSCDAFGVSGLIITGHSVDIYDPDVIVASMGSFFTLPFIRLETNSQTDAFISSISKIRPNLKIIGTTAHTQTAIFDVDLTAPVIFFIGNEADGLNNYLKEASGRFAAIPMDASSEATSLNISCALTVMLYETARQRKQANTAPT